MFELIIPMFLNNQNDSYDAFKEVEKWRERKAKREFRERKGKHMVYLRAISKRRILETMELMDKKPIIIENYVKYDKENLRDCLINLAKEIHYTNFIDSEAKRKVHEYDFYCGGSFPRLNIFIGRKGLKLSGFRKATDSELKMAVMSRKRLYEVGCFVGLI